MAASASLERYVAAAREAGCPRQQIENLVRFGQVLQPKQLTASAAARECDKPGGPIYIGFGGARGPGKSHWAVVQVAVDDCQRAPGLRCLLLRKVGKAAKEGFESIRSRVLRGVPHKYNSSSGVLTLANGSTIVIGHFQKESDIDAYLGLEYDVIIVEEATTLTWTKVEAILTCLRTSRQDWRPRAYFTTNPGGVGHKWFKKMFWIPYKKGEESDTRFIPATARDNKMLDAEYVRTKLETLSGWKRKAWLDGDFEIDAGLFFSNFSPEVHVIKRWVSLPGGARFVLSLDHGWTHPTAAHLGMVYDGKKYIVDEYGGSRVQVKDHAQGIKDMLKRWGLETGDMSSIVAGHDIWAKRDEGKCIADTYSEHGIDWDHAKVDRIQGAGAFLDGFGDTENEIEPTLYLFDTCPVLAEQLSYLEHDPKRPDDVLKVDAANEEDAENDDPGRGGDDYYDSGRYNLMELISLVDAPEPMMVARPTNNRFSA